MANQDPVANRTPFNVKQCFIINLIVMRSIIVTFLMGALITVAACQPSQTSPVQPLSNSSEDIEINLPTGTNIPATPTIKSTIEEIDLQPTSTTTIDLSPTPVPDPLRFVIPTSAPAAVSAWRPPLYPTPWAPTPFDHFFFSRPIAANEINWPLTDYRYGGVFLPEVVHTGIDIPAPTGTEVLAAGAGKVVWAGYGLFRGVKDPNDPYGLAVTIKHDFGFQGEVLYTVYGHLQRIDVTVGQHVEPGHVIGLVGQTGKVTGPHLHFEVRVGKNDFFVSRNPELWLAPPQGWGVLVARIMNTSGYLLDGYLAIVHSKDEERWWHIKTYGGGAAVSDNYYQENFVLGDLPAGKYEVWIAFAGSNYNLDFEIKPGMVTYFSFRGRNGFFPGLPPTPGSSFTPPDSSLTTSP
jgi:murein DD-endopeptidase MepM/ murein hydrolase activator NlpD